MISPDNEGRITVQEGPKKRTHLKSTIVGLKGDGGFWVSTIGRINPGFLPYGEPRCETMVFPLPPGTDVVSDSEGNIRVTDKTFKLEEAVELDISRHTGINLPRTTARRYHQRAVSAATAVLAGRA